MRSQPLAEIELERLVLVCVLKTAEDEAARSMAGASKKEIGKNEVEGSIVQIDGSFL